MQTESDLRGAASEIRSFCSSIETGGEWAKNRYTHAVQDASELGLRTPNWDEYQQAQNEYRDRLRDFVDRWLNAGLKSNGSEEPPLRKISLVDRVELDRYVSNYYTAALDEQGKIQPAFKAIGPY
jgi:hypothetical protein